jgi:hypothetical protein
MLLDNSKMLNDFSKHLNSRFTSLDFLNATEKLVRILNNPESDNQPYYILLPCHVKNLYEQLVKFKYISLLEEMINRITIDSKCHDVFISEMDNSLFQLYLEYIHSMKNYSVINLNNEEYRFEIRSTEIFVDLTIPLFSQLHNELISQLEYFNRLIEINSMTASHSNYTDNLYIQSRVSNSYSYFILAFLAENLGINLSL